MKRLLHSRLIRIGIPFAALFLMTLPNQGASLTKGSRVKVSTNVVDFNISVFSGKAGYEGDNETPVTSGPFGDGTVTDYRFFSSPGDAISSYANGGAGLIGMATSPAGNIGGGGESWSDLWTTNDPGIGYTTTPNFPTSVNTFARSANISGSIDISDLESGSVYIPHGTYINDWSLTLRMMGNGQPTLTATDTQGGNGPSTNFGWITDFIFADASQYDTISYTYINGDTDGSRARFMGIILDGTPLARNPPTVVNQPASNISFSSATVGGEVTTPGGSAANIAISYGQNDGGNDLAAWETSVDLGSQTGIFSAHLLGLSPSTTYYFRSHSGNLIGSNWAGNTLSFTTAPPPDPPTITISPASGITAISALVSGQVTTNGGDSPEVAVYYGKSDGGNDPNAWENSTSFGSQGPDFTGAITGLSPLTTYHFRIFIENTIASVWSPNSESFTTGEISELVINEFLAANDGTYPNYPNPGQVAGRTDDWLEILNTSTETQSLTGWHLTDDSTDLIKWTFPAGSSINPGNLLLVYASGDNQPDANGNLHTNFKLNAQGEYLALVRPDLTIASGFGLGGSNYPPQDDDVSFGLHPISASPVFFVLPTPGTTNDPTGLARVADTKFSIDRGIHVNPINVEITTATIGATIYYTTNGEDPITSTGEPAPAALVYSSPLDISQTTRLRATATKPGYEATNIDTQTYVFLSNVANQPANPPGVPANWGSSSADYGIDPDVTETTLPGHSFEEALVSIPTMSLSTAPGDLFGSSNGIYNNSGQKGDAWERQASLEFIDPRGGNEFQIDCGVAVHGASSRGHGFTKKHSLRLLFKNQFGAPKLEFPLFEDGPTEKFDMLILRACSTDSWPATEGNSNFGIQRWRSEDGSYQRDQWMRDTQVDLGHDSARGRYVHLYLNGLYWGLYNIVERPNSSFHSSHFGGEDEDWDVIHDRGELQSGDTLSWSEMFEQADAGLASDAAYMKIQGRNTDGTPNPSLPVYLDLEHFIDYMIFHIYAGAEDWPCHNYWAARRRGPDSEGFRFYVWDQEISNNSLIRERTWCSIHFELLESDVPFLSSRSDLRKSPAKLYYQLRQNSQFRNKFTNRVHELLFNDGLLSPEQSHSRWMRRAHEIDQAIVGESARWGDSRLTTPHKRETKWLPHQAWLRDTYWPANHNLAVLRFQNVDLYPSVEAPVFKIADIGQHGGQIAPGEQVAISHSAGNATTYYTIDGSDPLLPNGEVSPAAVRYTAPVILSESRMLQARSLVGDEWSALTSALFTVDVPLRITEIMYNPEGDDTTEYIELMNISENPINLAEIHFDGSEGGIEFPFDLSEPILGIGERIVVARNQSAFIAKYGTSGIRLAIGEYDVSGTKLGNDGEQITLRDPLGGIIQQFTFNDVSPWPELPDGSGPSLVLIAPLADPAPGNPENWRLSSHSGGRPGRSDSVSFSGDPNADLNRNGVPDLVDHSLTEDGSPTIKITEDTITYAFTLKIEADDISPHLEISPDLLNWTDDASVFTPLPPVYLGTGGLLMRFAAPRSALPAPPYFLRVNFQLIR